MVAKTRARKDIRSNVLRGTVSITADAITQAEIELPISLAQGQAILIDAVCIGGVPVNQFDDTVSDNFELTLSSRDDTNASTGHVLYEDGVFYYYSITIVGDATSRTNVHEIGMPTMVVYNEYMKPLIVNNNLMATMKYYGNANTSVAYAVWYRIIPLKTTDIIEALEQSGNL